MFLANKQRQAFILETDELGEKPQDFDPECNGKILGKKIGSGGGGMPDFGVGWS